MSYLEAEANGLRPAYPDERNYGLTKRELFAAMAMQGILSGTDLGEEPVEDIVENAVFLADEFLKALQGRE